jgi:hypothetical protein
MSDTNIEQNQQVSDSYQKLLDEFTQSREDLKKMLSDIESCKNDVLKDVSTSNDYRNKYAREERLKTLSTFFQNELSVRQEYNRSLLAEIDVRRKLDKNDSDEMEIDIREIAKQLSKIQKET